MQEIWKDVPEYEGLYQVSNLGSVRSLTHTKRSSNGKTARANGKVIKPLEQNGYTRENISKCCRGERETADGYKWKYVRKDAD